MDRSASRKGCYRELLVLEGRSFQRNSQLSAAPSIWRSKKTEKTVDWITIQGKEDVEILLARVEDFHDWYVAGFVYDLLALSEDDDLNLGRFKIDNDDGQQSIASALHKAIDYALSKNAVTYRLATASYYRFF